MIRIYPPIKLRTRCLLALIAGLGLPALTIAQVYVDVSLCRNITDATARVECYDFLVNKALSEQQADTSRLQEENRAMRAELARLRKNSPTPSGNSELSNYGLPQTQDRVIQNDDDKELIGTIAGLQQGQNGWFVTLESGQVWRQMDGKSYNIAVGDQVRIYPTIWGSSYRLVVEKLGKYIQVERVK